MEYKYIRCKRCNRLLKSNDAKMRGYGTYCWMLHKKEMVNKKYFQQSLFNILEK